MDDRQTRERLPAHTGYGSNERTKNQVSVEMADKAGQWRGDCSGNSCSVQTLLQEGAKFPQKGHYIFTISQNNRIDSLQFIEKIGLKLQKQAK